ncbi:MAG: VWA domain-containing protein [Vicinamibacterales bacterium]|nr:VWA domain-containing protein [Vicinamibacterales bacterium]
MPTRRRCVRWSRRAGAVLLTVGLATLAPGAQGPIVARQAAGASQQAPPPQGTPAAPAGQQQPPVFRAGVNFVRVDVIVSDRQGNPVTDLTADDFEVIEDGQAQRLELFKLINADGNPGPGAEPARPIRSRYDEEAEANRDDVRLFVVFLDDYHVRLGNSMRVRDPLVKFIQTQLGPLDMVGVMYPLMSVSDISFTRDHESVVRAIRQFEGRKYDYRPRNQVEEKYAYYPAQTIETLRNQITISALEGLCVRLGSIREGRKAVILVSEGFTALLPPQMRDPMAAMPGVGNPVSRNPMAGESTTEERARFLSEIDLQRLLRDVYDAANRHNTAFYALDPRGLAASEFDINESVGMRVDSQTLRQSMDTLRVLAEESDGRAIVNQNDLDKGLRQIIRDTSAYYLLGYNTSSKSDGKFHKVDVKVKRPGVEVRSRKGYWASTAAEAAAAAAPPKPRPPAEVEKALGAMEGRSRDALTTTWAQMLPGGDGQTRVTFVWEPIPATIGVSRQEPVAIQLTASTASGETLYRGRVPEASDEPEPAAAAAPASPAAPAKPSRVSFDARPGRVQLRMAIENAKGQVIDTTVQELTVPDLTTPAVRVVVPAVFRARTAREFQALGRDPDPVPTASRSFRRTDRLLIRFSVSAPGTATPAVAVRLLNRQGSKMLDLTATAPADGADYYQIDLPLSGFAAGDYLVEVSAESGDDKASELVPMHITG